MPASSLPTLQLHRSALASPEAAPAPLPLTAAYREEPRPLRLSLRQLLFAGAAVAAALGFGAALAMWLMAPTSGKMPAEPGPDAATVDFAASTAPPKPQREQIAAATASSYASTNGQPSSASSAALSIDGDTRTAWCEGVDGPGVGQTLRLTLAATRRISRIDVVAGVAAPPGLAWGDNSLPSMIDVVVGTQRFVLQPSSGQSIHRDTLLITPPVIAREVMLILRETIQGTRFPETTCISEVSIWATPDSPLPKGSTP